MSSKVDNFISANNSINLTDLSTLNIKKILQENSNDLNMVNDFLSFMNNFSDKDLFFKAKLENYTTRNFLENETNLVHYLNRKNLDKNSQSEISNILHLKSDRKFNSLTQTFDDDKNLRNFNVFGHKDKLENSQNKLVQTTYVDNSSANTSNYYFDQQLADDIYNQPILSISELLRDPIKYFAQTLFLYIDALERMVAKLTNEILALTEYLSEVQTAMAVVYGENISSLEQDDSNNQNLLDPNNSSSDDMQFLEDEFNISGNLGINLNSVNYSELHAIKNYVDLQAGNVQNDIDKLQQEVNVELQLLTSAMENRTSLHRAIITLSSPTR